MCAEIHYADCDEDGIPYGTVSRMARPKWSVPAPGLEQEILDAAGRKFYQKDERDFKTTIAIIVKSASPMIGKDMAFPLEWVQDRIAVCRKMRSEGKMVGLKGLITMITDTEKKRVWMDRWIGAHRNDATTKNDVYTGNADIKKEDEDGKLETDEIDF